MRFWKNMLQRLQPLRPKFWRSIQKRICWIPLPASVLIAACSPAPSSDSQSLKLGYIPYDTAIADREEAFQALRVYLQKQLEIPVTLIPTASYQPAINAMRSGEIDVINFGAYAYLIAESNGSAEAFAVRGQPNGRPYDYHCVIICPANRPWLTIEEALAEKRNLDVLFTNRASTSGYLIARSFYKGRGIEPESDFKDARFSNSHVLSVLYASQGECDLASVSSNLLQDMIERGKIDQASVRVLWRSDSIPNGPIAYRPGLDAALKEAVRNAFYEAHKMDTETWTLIQNQYPDQPFIYIPASTENFRSLKKLLKQDETAAGS